MQKIMALVTNHNSEAETWMEYPNNINLSKTKIDVNSLKIQFPAHSKNTMSPIHLPGG
jgi:hypothetical protein